jgi:hypothetical protein
LSGDVINLFGDAAPGPECERVTLGDLAEEEHPLEWVVEGLLPANSTYIVAGMPKLSKKSMLMLWLAKCVATGEPFLGRRTFKRPVIYSALEDERGLVSRRARAMGAAAMQDLERKLCVVMFGLPGYHVGEKAIGDGKILWICDPMIEVTSSQGWKEIESEQMANFLRRPREITHRTGSTTIFVHHFRKLGDRMRGSGALEGGADGWWNVMPSEKEKGLLKIEFLVRAAESTDGYARFCKGESESNSESRIWFEKAEPKEVEEKEQLNVAQTIDRIRERMYDRDTGKDELYGWLNEGKNRNERGSVSRVKLKEMLESLCGAGEAEGKAGSLFGLTARGRERVEAQRRARAEAAAETNKLF